ncbi:MAG: XRE family transcriptional regulator [Proteobacteria bacterium]|nr:XRE family transcriptional regulator [Pseudomonadota bacterium]
MDPEAEIGKRIKIFRKSQSLTLQDLSDRTGLSQGYLSKVENSSKAPPVATLIKLSKALNMSISSLFGENENSRSITLVRKDERRDIARDGSQFGYSYQALAPNFADQQISPYIICAPDGGEFADDPPLFQHEGQELFFVLEGSLRFIHGDAEFIIEAGDCLYFDSGVPHTGVSLGDKESKALVAVWAPTK